MWAHIRESDTIRAELDREALRTMEALGEVQVKPPAPPSTQPYLSLFVDLSVQLALSLPKPKP